MKSSQWFYTLASLVIGWNLGGTIGYLVAGEWHLAVVCATCLVVSVWLFVKMFRQDMRS